MIKRKKMMEALSCFDKRKENNGSSFTFLIKKRKKMIVALSCFDKKKENDGSSFVSRQLHFCLAPGNRSRAQVG